MPQTSDLLRLSDSIRSGFSRFMNPAVKSNLFSTAVKTDDSAGCLLLGGDGRSGGRYQGPGDQFESSKGRDNVRPPVFSASIFAADSVVAEFSMTSAIRIAGGERIGSRVSAVVIDGAATGETAFHFMDDGGTMVVGDALMNFEPYGFTLLPAKYCSDQKVMWRSLRRLLDWQFERLLFAHGTPILAAVRKRLETLLR